MKFYSQFGEDQWIIENISVPNIGFFIEIGCGADGVYHSNTKYFEDHNWTGFLIEADPTAISEIQKHRNCPVINYAIANSDYNYVDFFIHEDKEYSGVLRSSDQKIAIKSIKLKTLLNNLGCNKTIDILSIDTEGTELDVLDSMEDLRPNILIVEYNTALVRNDVRLVWNKLENLGYEVKTKTECNLIAVHKI